MSKPTSDEAMLKDAIRGARYEGEQVLFEQLAKLGPDWRNQVEWNVVALVDMRANDWRTHKAKMRVKLQKHKRRMDRRYERRHGKAHPLAGPYTEEQLEQLPQKDP
jgi:hypothetical protein